MNLTEAFEILKNEGITTHENSVRRWIRNNQLKAFLPSRAKGYQIELDDLLDFMKTKLSQERFEEVKQELTGTVMSEVIVLKEKKGLPTKIQYQGREYALIHESTAKGKKNVSKRTT